MTFRFADPVVLYLLFILPVLYWGYSSNIVKFSKIRYSRLDILRKIPGAISNKPKWIPFVMRLTAIALLIMAAARPQQGENKEIIKSQGVDIVIALDISGSMRALDFHPSNRLEVAKQVIREFIENRPSDRIALVLFGSDSFTLCPLTLDHDLLIEFLNQAQIGMVEEKTAIGKAITTAINRLRLTDDPSKLKNQDRAKSQLIILCTDGVNTVKSSIDPLTGAKAAKSFGIKINTIGVGTNGYVDFPHPNFPGRTIKAAVELDEDTLREIAKITGGDYFPARNSQALKRTFDTIDKMEKVEIDSYKYTRYNEIFGFFLMGSLLVFALEIVLKHTFYRRMMQ